MKRYLPGLLLGAALALAFCLGSTRPHVMAQSYAGRITMYTADASGACVTAGFSDGELWINTSNGRWFWCNGGSENWTILPPASLQLVQVSIAMTGGSGLYSTTVTGQTWVTATSKITCTSFGTTADGLTAEQVALAAFSVSVGNLVPGAGFDLFALNTDGSSGTVRFSCQGY